MPSPLVPPPMGNGHELHPGQVGHLIPGGGELQPHVPGEVALGDRTEVQRHFDTRVADGGGVGRLLGVPGAARGGQVQDDVTGDGAIPGEADIRLVLPEADVEPGLELLDPLGPQVVRSAGCSWSPAHRLRSDPTRSPAPSPRRCRSRRPAARCSADTERAECRSGRTPRGVCRRSGTGWFLPRCGRRSTPHSPWDTSSAGCRLRRSRRRRSGARP